MIELILSNAPQAFQDGGLPLTAAVMLLFVFFATDEWMKAENA